MNATVGKRSRHEGPQDTEVAPAAAARGHENGPRRRAPGVLPGTQSGARLITALKTGLAWIKPAAHLTITQPRPASTLVAANFFVRWRHCAPACAQRRLKKGA